MSVTCMASECAAGRSVVANAELFEQLLQAKLSNTKISVQVDAVRNERHNIEVLVAILILSFYWINFYTLKSFISI